MWRPQLECAMRCVNTACGMEIRDGARFCPHCSSDQTATSSAAPPSAYPADQALREFGHRHGVLRQEMLDAVKATWARTLAALGANGAAWSDPLWASGGLTIESGAERLPTRVGEFVVPVDTGRGTETLTLPAVVPVLGSGNVFIRAPGAHNGARMLLQSIALRLLASVPPGKLRMTLMDPVGLGQNLSSLLELSEAVRGEHAWSDPKAINERLSDTVANMSMIFQTRLRNTFANIEEFNRDAGDEAEPYRLLIVSDFPASFNDEGLELLTRIAEKGRTAGIYTLLEWDTDRKLRRDFNPDSLLKTGTVINYQGSNGARVGLPSVSQYTLRADEPPSRELVKRLTVQVNRQASEASVVKVSLKTCLPETPWEGDTGLKLEVPIGLRGVEKQVFTLGSETEIHALVGGMTGSGKSVLLHAIILSLCHHYSPDEFELFLVDFKQGVEFQHYRELPHARVVSIESEREFGLSVLRGLRDEMLERGRLFTKFGVSNLKAYRKASGKPLPRVLLVVDEFQVFFERRDKLATEAGQLIEKLARESRASGIHVLLATQSMPGDAIDPGVLGQFGLRIALRMPKDVPNRILALDNPAASAIERPGQAIYNHRGGVVGSDKRFQVAFIPDGGHVEYVDRLAALAAQRRFTRRPLVFEGNKPATIARNEAFVALWSNGAPTPLPKPLRLFLGEPVRVVERHVAFPLRRQEGANLLIVGRDEEAAMAMMLSAALSVACWLPGGKVRMRVLDLTKEESPVHGKLEELQHAFPDFQYGLRGRLGPTLAEAARELEERAAVDARGERVTAPPLILMVAGLQAALKLRKEGVKNTEEGARFQKLVTDGANVGIHIIAWVDQLAQLQTVLDNRQIQEFRTRVALHGAEIEKVIPALGANATLRHNYGYYVDVEEGDEPEKLRCYGDVTALIDQLKARQSTHV